MAHLTLVQRMERLLRTYFQACNDADARAIAACFSPDAVHYFPHHAGRTTKLVGADTIGSKFARVVQEQGVFWTVDQLLIDVDRYSAALGDPRQTVLCIQLLCGSEATRCRRNMVGMPHNSPVSRCRSADVSARGSRIVGGKRPPLDLRSITHWIASLLSSCCNHRMRV